MSIENDARQVLDISPLVMWAVVGGQLLNFGLAIWGIISSASKKNAELLDQHTAQIAAHDQRLAAVEHTARDLPTRSDFHELELKMSAMTGEMRVLSESMKPWKATAERLQEWIIAQGNH